jgi:hypothetical protein
MEPTITILQIGKNAAAAAATVTMSRDRAGLTYVGVAGDGAKITILQIGNNAAAAAVTRSDRGQS